MYDTTIAAKLFGQLESFLGRISPHFHKPVARFIGAMIYVIMVEKDVKLASVVRALKEKTTPKKVEDRLSRMLSSDGLEAGLHGFIASEGARKVRKDTLIILDPSDVQKPYARKMEYLAKVWDGSKGDVGDNLGFWGCMAVACEDAPVAKRSGRLSARCTCGEAVRFPDEQSEEHSRTRMSQEGVRELRSSPSADCSTHMKVTAKLELKGNTIMEPENKGTA